MTYEKQEVNKVESINGSTWQPPAAAYCLIILYMIDKYYRDTYKSIPNSPQLYGSDGRSYSDVVTVKVSKSTEPEPTFG